VHLVETFFSTIDFRRFQVDLRENIGMDNVRQMDRLLAYGERLGRMVINDKFDRSMGVVIKRASDYEG
jgi:hypothetical protein